jgi:hypothetical protein
MDRKISDMLRRRNHFTIDIPIMGCSISSIRVAYNSRDGMTRAQGINELVLIPSIFQCILQHLTVHEAINGN